MTLHATLMAVMVFIFMFYRWRKVCYHNSTILRLLRKWHLSLNALLKTDRLPNKLPATTDYITKRPKPSIVNSNLEQNINCNFKVSDNRDFVDQNQIVNEAYFMRSDNVIKVDVGHLQSLEFDNVQDIRDKVNRIFAPQKVKMIWKRAERVYANGYCVFVLYWNMCK